MERRAVLNSPHPPGSPNSRPGRRPRRWTARVLVALLPAGACASAPREAQAPEFPPVAPSIPPPLAAVPGDGDSRLGTGDLLAVRVFELERVGEVSNLEIEVGEDGTVSLPLLGALEAAGRSTSALREGIEDALRDRFLRSPHVAVTLREPRSRRVLVVGAVARPGTYVLARERATALDALALAGGTTERAGDRLEILRAPRPDPPGTEADGPPASPIRFLVDLESLLEHGDLSADHGIEPGDVIRVPEAGLVSVSGFVGKPGVFPLRRKTTALQAVAAAGGYAGRRASPSAAFVRRARPDGTVERIPLDLEAIADGEGEDLLLLPGDHLEVPQTGVRAFFTEAWDFLRGRVGIFWPGSF